MFDNMKEVKSNGQLLIEILIALAVMTVAMVGALAVSTRAIRVSRVARSTAEASKYAENVLETLKRTKESDPGTFFTNSTCPVCGPFGVNLEYSCSLSCSFNGDVDDVTVTVSWVENGSTSSVKLQTILTKSRL